MDSAIKKDEMSKNDKPKKMFDLKLIKEYLKEKQDKNDQENDDSTNKG